MEKLSYSLPTWRLWTTCILVQLNLKKSEHVRFPICHSLGWMQIWKDQKWGLKRDIKSQVTIFSCSVILKESQHMSVRAFLLLWPTELLEGWQVNPACLPRPTKYRLQAGNCCEVLMDPNGAFLVSFPCDLLANYTWSHQRLLYDLWLQNYPPNFSSNPHCSQPFAVST